MTELESGFRLTDVIALLRRRSAIVLGAAILGLLAGYLVFATAAPKYSASARVELHAIPDDPTSPTVNTPASKQVDMGTEADFVKSDQVANAVRKKLGTTGNPFANLIVTVKTDSRVMGLSITAPTATKARDTVNAIAQSYLDERTAAATAKKNKAVDSLRQELSDANATATEARRAFEATDPGSDERSQAQQTLNQSLTAVSKLKDDISAWTTLDTTDAGTIVKLAKLPPAVLSKKSLAMGVGVFGLFVLAGLGVALLVDRRDSMGGGRRKVQQLVPGANLRMMPTASGKKVGPAEVDAAIDRLAVELAGGGSRGRAASVLVVGTRTDPPVALAEELASSLTFAGIPTLFVLAGTTERDLRQAHVIASFTDLITGPSITGPASLPDVAGASTVAATPTVTWLRPRGSAEASGLLRRAVVEALITRAGREGFEAVVFVAATPTRNAAAAALGQWVAKTAVIVEDADSQGIEQTVSALKEADVSISEIVWT